MKETPLENTHEYNIDFIKATIQELKRGETCYVYSEENLDMLVNMLKLKGMKYEITFTTEESTDMKYWAINSTSKPKKYNTKDREADE